MGGRAVRRAVKASGRSSVAGKELQLGRAGSETGELDGKPLDRLRGRALLEACLERRRDATPLGRRILEHRLDQPGGPALELRAHAHLLHPPPGATRMRE